MWGALGLNEVQLPKELQRAERRDYADFSPGASMKCSSRRNCKRIGHGPVVILGPASMKCSSRRNCNLGSAQQEPGYPSRLNEVQLPKELQRSA